MNLRTGLFILSLVFAAWLPPAAAQDRLQAVDFKPAADKPIEKIAVLAIHASRQVQVNNQNAAGTAFGILPALIYGISVDRNGSEYVAEMNKRKMTLAPQLAQLLHRELSRKYKVVWTQQRARQREDKSADYSHITTDADAILSVFYGRVGYLSPYSDTDYLPMVILGVRLLDAKTKETLYYKQFAVHPNAERLGKPFEAVVSDGRYRYRNFETLMADFERSIEGLLVSQETLGLRIARDLQVPEKPVEAAPAPGPAPVEPPNAPQEADQLSSPPPLETPNGDKQ
jgi:hypothetical protein